MECRIRRIRRCRGATDGRKARSPRPVLVWLHGGGFTAGSGPEFDPRRLATAGDALVVTVDFRLGALGYLTLPGMTDGGTYGLQDQQAALRWVRANARAFGGDPKNVTLFGESGGGVAVCGQLASPTARGLFQRAILQSGSCGTNLLPGSVPGSPAVPFWRPRAEQEQASAQAALDLDGRHVPLTARQREVAARLVRTWTTFARTGRPPATAQARWLPERPLALQVTARPDRTPRLDPAEEHHCGFWTGLEAQAPRSP